MAEYSQAADSQAAYAAMPNQGLPKQYGMSEGQRNQMAAKMLMGALQQGAQANAGMGQPAVPQRQAVPTQTLNAGQFVGGPR